MRRFTLVGLSVAAVLSLSAQNKIDFTGRKIIDAVRDMNAGARSAEQLRLVNSPYEISPEEKYTVIVTLDDESAEINDPDIEVISRRENMAIVRVTASQMETLAKLPEVVQLSVGNEAQPVMDHARATTGVDEVQTGEDGLDGVKYTGKGVVTGLMDQGLDVNHINFLTEDGELRTKRVWSYNSNGRVTAYETPEKISKFTTENNTSSHGTHVLGIMSGSYKGPATYALVNARGSVQIKKQEAANSAMPYYGIATDADIAVACGPFRDSNIELGVQNVIEYAKSVGQPCVVNVSIGTTIGPHDGTDARSRWLASLGKDGIICIAAGNDGNAPVSISKTFESEPLKTFVSKTAYADGSVEFWGSDNRVFKVRLIAYNRTTGEEVFSYAVDENLKGQTKTLAGSYYNAPGYIHDPEFDAVFGNQGALIFSSNIDPNNDRYVVNVTLQLKGSATNIATGFVVEAAPGQHVDAFANGEVYFTSLETEGFTDGTPDCSINGLACGENVLVVGSYTNVTSWPTLNNRLYTYQGTSPAGAISNFSSYGETFDGRLLPDVCAPGGSVIASYSKYYVDKNCMTGGELDKSAVSGMYTGSTRNSYWGEMQGTSMACPFVSGVIATWLQADPTLNIDDIKAIISRTATHDEFTAQEPDRWGAGKINALAGVKDILGLSGISEVIANGSEPIITRLDNRNFEIFISGAKNISVGLFSLSGLCVSEISVDGETAVINADSVIPGIYVMKITSGKFSEAKKIVIK